MICENAVNHILKCRQFIHRNVVDVYAKIETEPLHSIKSSRVAFRRTHLFALCNCQWRQCERQCILKCGHTTTFTGSLLHAWDEITELLLSRQSASKCRCIVAHVLQQKLKPVMNFIQWSLMSNYIFLEGPVVEWQKRGLSDAHILIGLVVCKRSK